MQHCRQKFIICTFPPAKEDENVLYFHHIRCYYEGQKKILPKNLQPFSPFCFTRREAKKESDRFYPSPDPLFQPKKNGFYIT